MLNNQTQLTVDSSHKNIESIHVYIYIHICSHAHFNLMSEFFIPFKETTLKIWTFYFIGKHMEFKGIQSLSHTSKAPKANLDSSSSPHFNHQLKLIEILERNLPL